MTLAGLSERAAADKRKCCAIKPPRPKERKANMNDAQALVKPGGGCYIISEKRDMLFHSVWGGSPRPERGGLPGVGLRNGPGKSHMICPPRP